MENYFSNFSLEDQNFMIDFLLSEGNISISYTHLDVYKRQI
ncbi:hypothetical protein A5872_002625 [Enterococcus faecium]|nr:hypothetical protein A5872_002625 [Enterococcus faecium]